MTRTMVLAGGMAVQSRGSILLEVMLLAFVLSLAATTLLTVFLTGAGAAHRAGQYVSGTALAQAILEEKRLLPYEELQVGTEEICPPGCPAGFARAQVVVDRPPYLPPEVKRVQVRLYRAEGDPAPAVQVVSYVRKP